MRRTLFLVLISAALFGSAIGTVGFTPDDARLPIGTGADAGGGGND